MQAVTLRSAPSQRGLARTRVSRSRAVSVRAIAEPYLQVSVATAAMLAVGRFAFLPFQRRRVEEASKMSPSPTERGNSGTDTYFDRLQQDASFIGTTNDPAGFGPVDLLAWGALGHALGFAFLSANSCGPNCIPGLS